MSKETLRRQLVSSLYLPENERKRSSHLFSGITACVSDSSIESTLQSWFDPLEISFDSDAGKIIVIFPHAFFGSHFATHYQALFEREARKLWGNELLFEYKAPARSGVSRPFQPTSGRLAESLPRPVPEVAQLPHPAGLSPAEKPLPTDLDVTPQRSVSGNPAPFGDEFTFDSFIANGKHKWILTLAREITRQALQRAANAQENTFTSEQETPGLLLLCGPHGTGKTHLLRSVGNELFRTFGNGLLFSSLNDLELMFVTERPFVVRQSLSEKRALLLDDMQYLSRMNGDGSGVNLQTELTLLFDRFLERGKPLILAGSGHPRDWSLEEGLASRLEAGLWAELPEPDLDVRVRYVQQQAKMRRLSLPREHFLLLAQHCPDIRRLSGVIRRAASHRNLLGRDLSEQDLLNIIRQSGDSSGLTPQLIVSIVGEHCGVPAREILGDKRRPDLVQARQIAMYLCRELLGHSYPVIGRMFGGKDHSTVMHGVKKIKHWQENDRVGHTMVTELTKLCRARHS